MCVGKDTVCLRFNNIRASRSPLGAWTVSLADNGEDSDLFLLVKPLIGSMGKTQRDLFSLLNIQGLRFKIIQQRWQFPSNTLQKQLRAKDLSLFKKKYGNCFYVCDS